jgi:hypothetical protein
MACASCIKRQRAVVKFLCKKPDSRLCKRAQARLDRMLKEAEKR